MRKKLRRSIAGILALLMVFSGFQTGSFQVFAEGSDTVEKTYTMSELTQTETWDVTAEDISEGGKKLTFGGNWKSIFYAVPADIDFADVQNISFNVKGDNAGKFAYKLFTEADYANKGSGETEVKYGNPSFAPNGETKAGVKYFGITSNFASEGDSTPIEMEISGVTFTVKADAGASDGDSGASDGDANAPGDGSGNQDDTPAVITEITYNFIDLEKFNSYNVDLAVGDGGELSMDFKAQYAESFYKLPAGLDASKIKQVTLNLTSGSAGELALKLYNNPEERAEIQTPAYGNNTIVPAKEFGAFGIMSLTESPKVKISGVTFKVEGFAEINKTYTFAELNNCKQGMASSVDGNGAVTLAYTGQYQENFYEIPKEIDSSKVHKVTFNVSSGNGDALAYKFYTEENFGGDWPSAPNEQVSYCNPSAQIQSGFNGMKYFGIMSMNAAEYNAVVDSVTFHTTGWGYSDKVEEEGAAEDTVYTPDEMSMAWASATCEMVDGKLKMSFAAQYDQAKLMLPKAVNLADCTEVKFTVENQTVPLSFKLWKGDTEVQVEYGKSGQTEYIMIPASTETIDAVGIMITDETPVNAEATLISVSFTMKESGEELGDNIIINGNFVDEDLSMWTMSQGNSVISIGTSDTPIFDDVKTYGIISRDPATAATSDAFVQDITANVEKGEEYQFEFYAKLSDEYANAPEEQRKVEFCPYFVVDGSYNYLGTYSSELSGTSSQALTVGEWTKYSGTFKISCTGAEDKVVIRIIEQGTNYGSGDCVKGDYYITGVSMRKIHREKPEIEQDIPDWKDAIVRDLGEGTIAGTSICVSDLSDEYEMQLVFKHFNAITLGNELKLDAMLNYQNDKCPENGTRVVQFNGEDLLVPVLNHSRADKILDKILEWNNANPDKKIKVRGHVLVWHSQAPSWFFKENYDAEAGFVSKEVMDKRLEWYVKTMLEYYTGENSKYKGMFYGWDVVNEAINDGTNTYRGADESGWAAVYGHQSNEYIIKAFQYANKYAPADLELYYNDYNDCVPGKVQGIVELMKAVLAADGTRIDAMGMQAHHGMDNPTMAQVEAAIRAYAAVVGKVQWTEFDIKASSSYDGTDATKAEEFSNMGHRYKDFYDVMKKLDAEDGIEVSGITMWGVVDKYSWLQSSSNVGGGASGAQKQCPLLFDDNYKAKPAYWAFVDADKLEPEIQAITITEYVDDTFSNGNEYSFAKGSTKANFIPTWDGNNLKVLVKVQDATVDENDAVTVYVESAQMSRSAAINSVTVKRADAKAVDGGYEAVVTVPLSNLSVATKIGFDVVVVNGSERIAFNDTTFTQDTDTKYYADAVIKPTATIEKGTITVDGEADDKWADVEAIPLTINLGAKAQAGVKILWDENNLYIYAEVKDAELNKDAANAWEQDSLEVFIDENNGKTESYDGDDKQYRINYANDHSFNGTKCNEDNMKSATKVTADGYVIEAAFKWTDITPGNGSKIGLELQINDADGTGKRLGTLSWFDETGMGWSGSNVYGTVTLHGEADNNNGGNNSGSSTPAPTPTPAPAAPATSPATGESGTPVAVAVVMFVFAGMAVVLKTRRKEEI